MTVNIQNKNGVDFDNVFEPGDAGFNFYVQNGSHNVDLGHRYCRVEEGESPGAQGVYGRNGAKTGNPIEDAGLVFAAKGSVRPKLVTAIVDYYEYLNVQDAGDRTAGGVFRIQTNFANSCNGTVDVYLLTNLDNQNKWSPLQPDGKDTIYRVCCVAAPYAVENVAEVTGKAGFVAEYNAAPNNFWKVTWKNNTVRRHCMTVSSQINKQSKVVQYISTVAYNWSNHGGANRNYPEFGLVIVVKDKNGNVIDGRHVAIETASPSVARNVFGGGYTDGHNWNAGFSAGDISSFGWVSAHTSYLGADQYAYHRIDPNGWIEVVPPYEPPESPNEGYVPGAG